MSAMEAAMKQFFGPNTRYFVLGASNSPYKYGHKVMKWYQARDLPVTPINPGSPEVCGVKSSKSLKEALSTLAEGEKASISVVTPSDVSYNEIESVTPDFDKIRGIWFQPGAWDGQVIQYVKENGLDGRVVYRGKCILIQGDLYRKESGDR